MSILDKGLAAIGLERRGKTIDQIAQELDGLRPSRTGIRVSVDTATEVSTVLACASVIANGCGVPDLHVMRRLDGENTEKARDDAAYRVFHRRPNEFQTAIEFRTQLTLHAALTGRGLAIPTFGTRGQLLELLPVLPHMVTNQTLRRWELEYLIADEFGPIGKFRHDQLFVIRNRMWDQISGLSAVRKAREAIGLALSAEENVAGLQRHGHKPGGILTTEQKLSKEAIDRLKSAWEKGTTGKNAYKTPVLDGGMEYKQMAMTAVDAQTNETRRLQIEEICRVFEVFPQIVGHTDKTATFASAEAFFSAHNRLTVGKWQKIWCEAGDEFLLDGKGPLFLEFDNRNMNAASLKDRGEYYGKALGAGGSPAWMTQNEVRAELGLPPKEGGDKLPKPTNAIMDGGEGENDDENGENDDDGAENGEI